MSKDKIIAAAKEAGAKFDPAWGIAYNCGTETFIRFYAIAFEDGRQAEREECAQILERQDVDPSFKHRMASAIRARSTK